MTCHLTEPLLVRTANGQRLRWSRSARSPISSALIRPRWHLRPSTKSCEPFRAFEMKENLKRVFVEMARRRHPNTCMGSGIADYGVSHIPGFKPLLFETLMAAAPCDG